MTGVEPAILKALTKASAFVATRVVNNAARNRVKNTSRPITAENVTVDALSELSATELEAFRKYFSSPDFEQVALHLVIDVCAAEARKLDDESLVVIRDELRSGLRHATGLSGWKLSTIADSAYAALLHASVESVRRIKQSGAIVNELHTAFAADLAAAATRNSALLERAAELSTFRRFAEDLRAQVRNMHDGIRLHHIEFNRVVPYRSLNINVSLQGRPELSPSSINKPIDGLFDLAFLRDPNRLVVLGDPGAGKSTLAGKFAYDVATSEQPYAVSVAPFVLVLRDYTEKFREGGHTLIEYIAMRCRDFYHVPAPEDAVEYLLLNGQAVVVLDGLDELTDVRLRRRVADLIEAFAHRYPFTPIVVTSRRIGYSEAALDGRMFGVSDLAEFSDDQVEEYAGKWFALGSAAGDKASQAIAKAFIAESAAAAPDLRRNPLVLSLLCEMYAAEHYIPQNLPEVFQKCSKLLFTRWDKMRGIPDKLRFGRQVESSVEYLAWALLNSADGSGVLPKNKLSQMLSEHLLTTRFEQQVDAEDAAERFLDYCSGRAWILAEVGTHKAEPVYGFTHRTFMEYFAAEYIVRSRRPIDEIVNLLRAKILGSEWEAVCQLIVQVFDAYHEGGAGDILARLVLSDASRSPDQLLLGFACRALAHVVPNELIVRQITAAATKTALSPATKVFARSMTLTDRAAPFGHLVRSCSPENFEAVSREVLQQLLGSKRSGINDLRIGFALLLRMSSDDNASSMDWSGVAGELAAMGDDSESAAPLHIAYLFRSEPTRLPEMIRRYGSGFLYYAVSVKAPWIQASVCPIDEFLETQSTTAFQKALRSVAAETADLLLTLPTPWATPGSLGQIRPAKVLGIELTGAADLRTVFGQLICALPVVEQACAQVGHDYIVGDGQTLGLGGSFVFARTHRGRGRSSARAKAFLTAAKLPPDQNAFLQRWLSCRVSTFKG